MLRRVGRNERGVVLVLFALTMVSLLGIAAFAIDLGNSRQITRHEQAGTDAGALAGAQELPAGTTANAIKAATARRTAAEYAVQSLFDGVAPPLPATPTCTGNTCTYVVSNTTIEVTTPYTPPNGIPAGYGSHNFVYVKACRPDASWFRSVWDSSERMLCRDAVGRHRFIYEGFSRGLIALDPTACEALEFDGSSTTNLHSDGAVVVESSCASNALDGGGAAWEVQAGLITVVGGYQINPCTVASCLNGTTPTSGVIPQGDPFAALPTPSVPPVVNPAPVSGGANPIAGGPACTQTYQPGRYTSQLSVNGGVACFAPGLYYLEAGFHSNGNVQMFGADVLFYIAGGSVQLNGTGRIMLEPVPVTADPAHPLYPWRGISIFQSRTNAAPAKINGNDASSIGTVYMPAAHLNFQGNASALGTDFVTGQVVAKTVEITGNGYLSINAEELPQGDPPDPDTGLHM